MRHRLLLVLLAMLAAFAWLDPGDVGAVEPGIITAIDATAGVVTAKDTATGRTFQFEVPDAALLATLAIGQGVYADFWAQKVAVVGIDFCCSIRPPAASTPASGQSPVAAPQGVTVPASAMPAPTAPSPATLPAQVSPSAPPTPPSTPPGPAPELPNGPVSSTARPVPAASRCQKPSSPSLVFGLQTGEPLGTWVDVMESAARPERCLYLIRRQDGTFWAVEGQQVRVPPW
jgi:hypothetical protein